jgi:hypothetical protein
VEAITGRPLRISYHATVRRDCTPGRLPSVRVLKFPTSGILTAKAVDLTTSRVAGCPKLKTPAQFIFCQSRAGYIGRDRVRYEVTSETGRVAIYDVTITVRAARSRPESRHT